MSLLNSFRDFIENHARSLCNFRRESSVYELIGSDARAPRGCPFAMLTLSSACHRAKMHEGYIEGVYQLPTARCVVLLEVRKETSIGGIRITSPLAEAQRTLKRASAPGSLRFDLLEENICPWSQELDKLLLRHLILQLTKVALKLA
jgi:hypothetical protein